MNKQKCMGWAHICASLWHIKRIHEIMIEWWFNMMLILSKTCYFRIMYWSGWLVISHSWCRIIISLIIKITLIHHLLRIYDAHLSLDSLYSPRSFQGLKLGKRWALHPMLECQPDRLSRPRTAQFPRLKTGEALGLAPNARMPAWQAFQATNRAHPKGVVNDGSVPIGRPTPANGALLPWRWTKVLRLRCGLSWPPCSKQAVYLARGNDFPVSSDSSRKQTANIALPPRFLKTPAQKP